MVYDVLQTAVWYNFPNFAALFKNFLNKLL